MNAEAVETEVLVTADDVSLPGTLTVPGGACGVAVFAHGSGSSRLSSRNQAVAGWLRERGCATLLFDLLTDAEAADRANVFDIDLLGRRVVEATAWLRRCEEVPAMPIGYFGSSTGAAAAPQIPAARRNALCSSLASTSAFGGKLIHHLPAPQSHTGSRRLAY